MNPKLEHLIGRTVEKVSTQEKQSALCLEGGYKIILCDKRAKWSKDLVGQLFQSVEDYPNDGLRLLFNQDEHVATKGKVLVFNPEDETTSDPYEPVDVKADLPPDPSVDRISEGPTGGESAANEEEAGNTQ